MEVEEPSLAEPLEGSGPGAPGEIIVAPEVACLCGSDLPYFAGEQPGYPLDAGLSLHEIVGTVIETTGSRFRQGDLV